MLCQIVGLVSILASIVGTNAQPLLAEERNKTLLLVPVAKGFKQYSGVEISINTAPRDISSDLGSVDSQKSLDILDFHFPTDIVLPLDPDLFATPKFFAEQWSDAHRAKGFGEDSPAKKKSKARYKAIHEVAQKLHAFAAQHDFTYWLAHGTLIGQHWGARALSFDDDLDFQTSFEQLHKLTRRLNGLFEDRYLFQVNPWYMQRHSLNNKEYQTPRYRWDSDKEQKVLLPPEREPNVIDARFIDTQTGVFADITVLSAESADDMWSDQEEGRSRAHEMEKLHDKSVHTYEFPEISPLRKCQFEGLEHWCPNKVRAIMLREYPAALDRHYQTYRFDSHDQVFKQMDCTTLLEMYTRPTSENCDTDCAEIVKEERLVGWVNGPADSLECKLTIKFTLPNKDGIRMPKWITVMGKRANLEEPLPEIPDDGEVATASLEITEVIAPDSR